MARRTSATRRIKSVIFGLACLTAAGIATWSLTGSKAKNLTSAGETTASIAQPAQNRGPSGLPLPRFVSLKAEKVNVRRGPSSDYPVSWVFQRKGLPVEIIAEFENWRRIRDSEGSEGWILQNMLTGKRTAMVAPWRKDEAMALHESPDPASRLVAKVTSGVVGEIVACANDWCEVSAGGYGGYIQQDSLWGVYPGERLD